MTRSHQSMTRTAAIIALAGTLLASSALGQATAPAAPPKAPPAAPAVPAAPTVPPAPTAPAAPKAMPKAPVVKAVETTGEKPTAAEVFKKHLDATGGEAALTAKKSMTSTGAMRMPSVGIEAPMTIKAMLPNLLAVSLELPQQGTTRMGFDGTTGWSIDPMRGPVLLGDAELSDFRRRSDFLRDFKLAKNPGKSEVMGAAEFNGKQVWQVRVVEEGDSDTTNLYDQSTGLMIGTMMVAKTQMGDIPVTVVVEEYGDFDGIKVPTRTVLWMMMQAQELVTKSVEWDNVTATEFALPKEIAALVQARDAEKAVPKAAAPAGGASAPPSGGKGSSPAGGATGTSGTTTAPKGK